MMWRLIANFLFMLAIFSLSACSQADIEVDRSDIFAPNTLNKSQRAKRQTTRRIWQPVDRNKRPFRGVFRVGSDQLTKQAVERNRQTPFGDERNIRLNLLKVSVAQAAKAIFGDILKVNYSVDSRITSTVTLQTTQPISKTMLAQQFADILSSSGVSVIENNGFFKIVPSGTGQRIKRVSGLKQNGGGGFGVQNRLISLQHVSVSELQRVLGPLVPANVIVSTDDNRNTMVVSGTPHELETIRQTIEIFDVDWMRGMSFAIHPLHAASPDEIVKELDAIFGTKKGSAKGIIRFVPDQRLNSVLVISSRSSYLIKARSWIQRLDRKNGRREASLHVYHVQNRTASELAKVLQAVYRTKDGANITVENNVAPKLTPATLNTKDPNSNSVAPTAVRPPNHQANSSPKEQTRVIADDANNSLLIVATVPEYKRILRVLQQIDAVPNQVLLEAVIAEVSLNDELKFGLRWFFGKNGHGASFSDVASGAVASQFPGFSYFLASKNVDVVLNALSGVTDLNVISSPSLMVLDNKTATLQVGDQVPIVTQSANNVTAPGAPIVNSVTLHDTGIILSITPRVNDSGRVILKIEQEVSSVVKTTTSGIDSPTIRQRKISTSVAVANGETLTLGGLIQEKNTRSKTKVPLIGDIPLLGVPFRKVEDEIQRTELIIFIRPRVIRDVREARQVTAEYRRQLSLKAPKTRLRGNKLVRDVKRIFD